MLEIETEFRHGIFFIRLIGVLNKKTVNILNEKVTNLIKSNGFKNIVFNIENLNYIDIKGINTLFYNYELSRDNHGNLMVCGLTNEYVRKKIKHSRLLNYVNEISDELTALKLINVWGGIWIKV